VDHTRTTMENLHAMGREGVFYVAYAAAAGATDAGLGDDKVVPPPPNTWAALPAVASGGAEGEAAQLLACVYLSVGGGADAHGPPPGDSSTTDASEGASATSAARAPRVGHIGMLTVAPEMKKRGVGQRVLDFALATAVAAQCTGVEAFVVSVKPWLRAWYESNGFAVAGRAEWPAACMHQLVHRQAAAAAAGGSADFPADRDDVVFFHRLWRDL
jgi:ribosomal protein S18 acetylase RimI-like enzyme